ncbi:MAG: hypothetical protein R2867_00095 [Caldilineaceae bacterium]
MNNAKSFQSPSITFGIGAIFGLLLGLFIGWVLWPVEWQGATLRDLDTAGKAEYMAAVADAYVIYDNPEALTIAQQRLAPLQENLGQEFVSAIRYFQSSSQPERAIRVSNLGRLASSLGMVPPDLQAPIAANPAVLNTDTAATDNVTMPQTEAGGSTADGSISWFRWLLWLIAACLLLGGGLYLLGAAGIFDWQRWLADRFAKTEEQQTDIDEFDENELRSNAGGRRRRPGQNDANTHTVDDLAFESEEEEIGRWHYDRLETDIDEDDDEGEDEAERFQYRPYTRPDAGTVAMDSADDDGDSTADWRVSDQNNSARFTIDQFGPAVTPTNRRREAEYTGQFEDDTEEDGTSADRMHTTYSVDELADEWPIVPTVDSVIAAANRTPNSGQSPNTAINRSAEFDDDDFTDELDEQDFEDDYEDADFAEEDLEEEDADGPKVADRNGTPASVISPVARATSSSSTSQPPASARTPTARSRYKVIDQHILQYQLGMVEYDESKPIVDPASGKYIGEFGMGTSIKNGLVQPNSDQVAALEVWLFDKSDEKNMGNQTRILLSEYAIDHNLEQAFVKERQDNPRPFTAQPGVHFQLESQNLLLDCTIVDVQYTNNGNTKGMFQHVKVDMSVHQKQ